MIRAIAMGAILAALVAEGQANAQAPADRASRLIQQLKDASGGPALDKPDGFHESGTLVRDGKPGTYEYWGDLHALRSAGSHTVAGIAGMGGFDGQAAWTVDMSGKVFVDASPKAVRAARLGAYVSIGGYFHPDRFPARFAYLGRRRHAGAAYDVVAVTPKDADTAALWLDAKTHRLMRISATADGVESDGDILRYQVVDGAWIGFSLSQTEGPHQMTQQLEHYVYGPVDAARFSPPNP
jgi:hypothetical protein